MHGSLVNILLVEDDVVDVKAFKRALQKMKIANPLTVAHDGLEALAVLRGTNGREKLERPYVILLDLNMPRMDGIEFLDEVRGDEALKDSVVFITTTSRDEADKIAAYDHNVAGYVVKSDMGSQFLEGITMLDHYWKIVELP